MKTIRLFFSCLLLLSAFSAGAKEGFAIVIDPDSYSAAKAEVDAYAAAITKADGYKVQIVEDVWGVPDSIRAVLKQLHFSRRNPIVGAVFVGNIPVAMVRGAQHLASAFKMDEQRYPREQSSIPSDRFYDDFSLEFEFIGHDEGTPLYYYGLTADGAQTLSPDIFSGRIRPVDENGNVRIDALKAFLLKAADARLNPPVMDQMLFFSGHGYISESKTARLDEKRVWLEHFPLLDDGRNHISYIDYSDVIPVKPHLMNEIMRPELNVAMLHHHGAPDTEYLNAAERPYMVKDAKEYIMKNLRDHLYRARERGKDYKKLQAELKARFDVPDSWFKDAFDEEKHKADSLDDASLDLYIDDFAAYGYKPAAQLVILDACYSRAGQQRQLPAGQVARPLLRHSGRRRLRRRPCALRPLHREPSHRGPDLPLRIFRKESRQAYPERQQVRLEAPPAQRNPRPEGPCARASLQEGCRLHGQTAGHLQDFPLCRCAPGSLLLPVQGQGRCLC